MKKQINEPDFIGGQGSLTKIEEIALREYFAEKKRRSLYEYKIKQLLPKRAER